MCVQTHTYMCTGQVAGRGRSSLEAPHQGDKLGDVSTMVLSQLGWSV